MTRRSLLLRACLTAASLATLSACATSRTTEPALAPDPIVQTRTVIRTVCPAEVTAAAPAIVAPYAGDPIVATQAYLDWLSAHLRREALLGSRLSDAKGQCPDG